MGIGPVSRCPKLLEGSAKRRPRPVGMNEALRFRCLRRTSSAFPTNILNVVTAAHLARPPYGCRARLTGMLIEASTAARNTSSPPCASAAAGSSGIVRICSAEPATRRVAPEQPKSQEDADMTATAGPDRVTRFTPVTPHPDNPAPDPGRIHLTPLVTVARMIMRGSGSGS